MGKNLIWCLVSFIVLSFCGSLYSADKSSDSSKDVSWKEKVVVIPVHGVIGPDQYGGSFDHIRNALDKAEKEKALKVILEIDSPGGVVDTCDKIASRLLKLKVPTTALILHKAVSGGAMVATACREIVMVRGSRIGDIQPMMMYGGKMDERTAEKIEVDVRTIMESNAEINGYPKKILHAMVSRSIELYEVHFTDGMKKYMTKKEFDILKEQIKERTSKKKIAKYELVVEKGKLLHLTPEKAIQYDIAKYIVKDTDEFYEINHFNPKTDVVRAQIPEGDFQLSKMIPSMDDVAQKLEMPVWMMILCGLFLVIGIAGAFTEAQMPGFGVPGAFGLIGFSCFFGMLFMSGRASPFEIILFVIGVILLIVEIVLIPGFGLAGVLGIIAIIGSLCLAFLPELGTPYMEQNMWKELSNFVLLLFSVLFCGIVVAYVLIAHGDRIPFVRYFYLQARLKPGAEEMHIAIEQEHAETMEIKNDRKKYLGMKGVAKTPLRPSGKVRLSDGTVLDVVSDGALIANGENVVVTEVDMNRIVVVPEENS